MIAVVEVALAIGGFGERVVEVAFGQGVGKLEAGLQTGALGLAGPQIDQDLGFVLVIAAVRQLHLVGERIVVVQIGVGGKAAANAPGQALAAVVVMLGVHAGAHGDELRRVEGHAADASEITRVAVHGAGSDGARGFVGTHPCSIVHIAGQLLLVGAQQEAVLFVPAQAALLADTLDHFGVEGHVAV